MNRWYWLVAALLVLLVVAVPTTPLADDSRGRIQDLERERPGDARTSTLDFRFEGLIFCDVTINGRGPYEMLFDSGATQTVLNKRLARELNLTLHDSPGAVQGVGEPVEIKLAVVDSVGLGDFRRDKTLVGVMDFDHMSGSLGRHMMGIIGQNVIRFMERIEIDFSRSKLVMTRYPRGQEPGNMQEEMVIRMLEGAGGLPGFPGLPELPELPDPRDLPFPWPDRPRPPDDREEDFSAPRSAAGQAWLLSALEGEGADEARRSPKEGMSLGYTTGNVSLLGLQLELIPYWYVEAKVNGQNKRFMFDTGASMLLVLGKPLARELRVPTSLSYPVKGIGIDVADSGIVDSFEIGNLAERDVACTILGLPNMIDTLTAQVGDLDRLVPGLSRLIPLVAGGLNFDGIIGITLATRYKKMIVHNKDKRIEFVPYESDETNQFSPFEGEDLMRDATVRVWQGKAGKFGLSGESISLDDWEKHGLESGGLKIAELDADGAAAAAGLQAGDIITHLVGVVEDESEEEGAEDGDLPIRDPVSLIVWACMHEPGAEVVVRFKRGDEIKETTVRLQDYGWTGAVPERFKR